MTTATLDELLAAGQLIVEPQASLDIPGDQLLTVLRVELAPGAVEPHHTHPGVEILYGVAGRGEVELDGRTPLPVGPGDVLPVERGHVKSLRNVGDAPFAVLAVLVLDAGKPPLLPALPAIAAARRPPEEHSGG
jgi:quercetin dioxygenase-like cupin family protein